MGGTAMVWVGLDNRQQPPPVPVPVHAAPSPEPSSSGPSRPAQTPSRPGATAGATARGGIPDPIAGTVLPASTPVSITIPRLGIHSGLERLGLDSTGAMQVPSLPAEAGWYDRGPTPGELGPAVIAGHVTWNLEPAVFYRLASLHRGDRVRVVRRDGLTAVFEVEDVRRFPKAGFPTAAVFGTIDYAGLRLITCGGTYDSAAHRYLANVVVFTRLVGVRRDQR
jgi:Sortase domain